MPRGDRTGPNGAGPMTGRGAGFCAGFGMPGFMNPGCKSFSGPGFGRGRGFGRFSGFCGAGFGAVVRGGGFFRYPFSGGFSQEGDLKSEKEYLMAEKKGLEETMESIRKRMEMIDGKISGKEGDEA